MAKVSRETASRVQDMGEALDISEDLEGYTVNFVTIRQDSTLEPLLNGLPNDSCQCPHWGYVLKGRLTFRYGDKTEVFEPGDAFYTPPGHVPRADAGSEFIQFSPAHDLQVTMQQVMKNAQQPMGA
jgi:mannose-6-phosphate isomerase-like protein (cupin superfamily)